MLNTEPQAKASTRSLQFVRYARLPQPPLWAGRPYPSSLWCCYCGFLRSMCIRFRSETLVAHPSPEVLAYQSPHYPVSVKQSTNAHRCFVHDTEPHDEKPLQGLVTNRVGQFSGTTWPRDQFEAHMQSIWEPSICNMTISTRTVIHRGSDFDVSLHMVFIMAGLFLNGIRSGSGMFYHGVDRQPVLHDSLFGIADPSCQSTSPLGNGVLFQDVLPGPTGLMWAFERSDQDMLRRVPLAHLK